jgi:hypothetical protein
MKHTIATTNNYSVDQHWMSTTERSCNLLQPPPQPTHTHTHTNTTARSSNIINRRTVLLSGVVLSIHSIFAGVTLGLASPGSSYSFDAFVALLLHKLFEAIALGVTVSRDRMTQGAIVNVVIYALCAPFGILLGALLASYSTNTNRVLSEALVVSITSGSFLYMYVPQAAMCVALFEYDLL